MKKNLIYFMLFAFVLTLSSCGGQKKGVFSPTSSGNPYELIVIINNDMWERPAGRAIYNVLDSDVPGLPQSERSFRIMQASPNIFDGTLKIIRNIIIVDVQKDAYTKGSFKTAYNTYAAPQAILTIQAPDEKVLAEFVEENKQVVIDYFTRAEMNRQIALLEAQHNDYISTKVASMFDCDIWLPGNLKSTKLGEDFLWASSNSGATDLSFAIYSYPYTDKETFTKEYFVAKRDSFMQANIPGAQEGMYVTTDAKTVQTRAITLQDQYTFEARGLWRMKGDFMGGPFVSISRVDEINNRVITAEIFVYSPDKQKKNIVRSLEASLYTLKLPKDRQPNN
ncbi:DUF4837 family protein [Bacteroides sp. 214]|uniref:DUF4837 family protein n=1 Tax=Bacteroides sp. 214 TaxID=2302935 RepID=UPI0013D1FA66|nr:DUF4837 family protein [Bacteroides sp. 214]NDW13379.1 DUF4837 family protein [Bacteroides sp. 214]